VNAARGAALVAAAAVGAAALDEPSWHEPDLIASTLYEPDPGTARAYADLTGAYQGLRRSLVSAFQHLARFRTSATVAGP
jgi:hypothetical protein